MSPVSAIAAAPPRDLALIRPGGVVVLRGLEPINRSKTIKLDKHELKALFERNATERDEAQAAERVEGMG